MRIAYAVRRVTDEVTLHPSLSHAVQAKDDVSEVYLLANELSLGVLPEAYNRLVIINDETIESSVFLGQELDSVTEGAPTLVINHNDETVTLDGDTLYDRETSSR
jgi:aminopeptidase-like protein